ncbi:membrane fusion protein (multidrug efflux system) [Tahibacter aquaticus]|uniref:Membrane fusion protein (Multidrug efflux system) n=1 Tax=Tahibacter aquaticus TaxID=520092 RepID=A0A4V6PYA7_9GAMM|nr:efflux RND transporter periplasmic adaptor subunit [Tahibacter aquaticus]TDR40366.1 membrane fusion protein (multidrug efflux system) [Tahibacter aquaticus]
MRQRYPSVVLVFACLSLAACKSQDQAKAATVAAPAKVTAQVVQLQPWSDVIEALGTARANESTILTAKITETVRRVNFSDGQAVQAGDVLVELTSSQQAAQLKDAQAMAKDADRQYQRQQDLVKQGTVSKALFDTAQASRDSNSAKVDAIRAQLSDRVITAPFSGVLGLRRVSPGTLVTPGTEITTLDDVDLIKLDFSVPETLLGALQTGQEVQATTAAWPERTWQGKISSIDSRVDSASRSVLVRAEILNPERVLRPGMLLSVKVFRAPRDVLVLPEIALVQVGTDAYVFRIKPDDSVEQVRIVPGARRRGEIEVREGLQAGDRIVLDGTVKLRSGARVAVEQRVAATTAPASN